MGLAIYIADEAQTPVPYRHCDNGVSYWVRPNFSKYGRGQKGALKSEDDLSSLFVDFSIYLWTSYKYIWETKLTYFEIDKATDNFINGETIISQKYGHPYWVQNMYS